MESTFDSGTEGWATTGEGVTLKHVAPERVSDEDPEDVGRPGGYLEARAENTGEIWFWEAPSAFTGDVSAAYNGALRFELRQNPTGAALDSSDVILEGESTTLIFRISEAPTSDWTAYRIPLRPSAGWKVKDTGEPASEVQIRTVLESLQNLRIRGNHWGQEEAASLENVRFQATQTIERWVDPGQTYLQTDSGDDARDAIAINLDNLDLAPGDQIHISRLGEYDPDPGGKIAPNTRMVAVFSESDILKDSDQQHRVPGAIDAGDDFPTNGLLDGSDIDEDFRVDGDVIRIPQGATHLFLSPYDAILNDNVDLDGDYKFRLMLPKPPSGLTATAPGDQVNLEWAASSFDNVVEYRIYRDTAPIDSTQGPGSFSAVADTTAEATTYPDESVSEGTTYYYRITAVDDAGNESALSKEVVATPGPQPSPPSDVRAQADGDSSAVVRWQEEPEAEKYRLYRDTAPITGTEPGALSPVDSTNAGTPTYTDTGLIPGQTYYYRITSVDPDGNKSVFSAEATARPPRSVLAAPDSESMAQADTTIIDVLANDVQGNAPLDTASVKVNTDADHGTTAIDLATGRIEYIHDGSTNFDDVFTYVVEDTRGATDTAQVVLSIEPVTLTTERDSVDLGIGQVGTSGPSAQLSFTSAGEAPAEGLSLTLSNQDAYAILDDTGEDVLEPEETREVVVRFQPDTLGEKQTTSVTLETKTGLQSTVVLTGDGVGAQVEAPTDGNVATLGEAVEVRTTPQPQGVFEPTSRRLYARPGGGEYRELDDTAQIPGSLVTRKGIDYYAVLAEGDQKVVVPGGTEAAARESPSHLPVQFDSLTAPISFSPRTYQMVSVPAQTAAKDAFRKSYGEYDPASWRALRWDPSAGEQGAYREYPEIDSLRAGMGVWIVTLEGTPLVLGNGRTVDASSPQEIVIEPGWNQVATPFGFAVPWDTVQTSSGLSDAEIDGPVGYRDSAGYQRDRSVLRAWEGYFVFNATGSRDTLVVPPVGAESEKAHRATSGPAALSGTQFGTLDHDRRPQSVPTGQTAASSVQEGEAHAERPYTLRVSAWAKGEQPRRVWLGLRPEAQVGRDALDFAQAPPVEQTIRLSVQEKIGNRSIPHAGSFKPFGGEGRAWTVVLQRPADESGQNGSTRTVRFQLNAEGTLPEGHKRYLLDLDDERRLVSGEALSLEAGEQRRLKVIVGTKAFARKESPDMSLENFENALRGNAPNPFAEGTTLTYVIEEKTEVTLEVYNVLGQRVRTLVQGQRDPGKHHVRWDGENRYGEPVGSGVYFYRIEAGDFRKTRKMVLVR